jgi:hypothetical protein
LAAYRLGDRRRFDRRAGVSSKPRELGLLGLIKSSGPEGQITAKIRKVDRSAPDPELFKIPPDYFIRELKEYDSKQ